MCLVISFLFKIWYHVAIVRFFMRSIKFIERSNVYNLDFDVFFKDFVKILAEIIIGV